MDKSWNTHTQDILTLARRKSCAFSTFVVLWKIAGKSFQKIDKKNGKYEFLCNFFLLCVYYLSFLLSNAFYHFLFGFRLMLWNMEYKFLIVYLWAELHLMYDSFIHSFTLCILHFYQHWTEFEYFITILSFLR